MNVKKFSKKTVIIISLILTAAILLAATYKIVDISRRSFLKDYDFEGLFPSLDEHKKSFEIVAKKLLEIYNEICDDSEDAPYWFFLGVPYESDAWELICKYKSGRVKNKLTINLSKTVRDAWVDLLSAYDSPKGQPLFSAYENVITFASIGNFQAYLYLENPLYLPYGYSNEELFLDRLSLHWFEAYRYEEIEVLKKQK